VPGQFEIGPLHVKADLISHPGSTLGYRITEGDKVLTYMPDHEPALGNDDFPGESYWTSGFELAENADILIHDTQYEDDEYTTRVGWGHLGLTTRGFRPMTSVSTPSFIMIRLDTRHDGCMIISGQARR
jgi:hypothetical protein